MFILRLFLRIYILIVIGSFSLFSQAENAALSDYKLGSGDHISIHVFGEEDLSLEVVLSDAGTISYPFLGELSIKGKTIGWLERLITDGLKGPYLVDPKVNVTVTEYRQFYIHGEVKQSGGYSFQPGLTVRKAITLAGGFSERASKNKIFVVREGVAEPIQASLDERILPGDTITVEDSFF